MKKLLLTLAAAVIGLSATADEVTFDFTKSAYGLPEYNTANSNNTQYVTNKSVVTEGAVSIVLDGAKDDAWRMWSDGLRAYRSASNGKDPFMTISANGGTITEVALEYVSSSKYELPEGAAGTWTGGSTSGTWTGSATEVTLNYTATANKALKTVKVTYTGGGTVVTVAAPVITCADNKVTITAADADAIYYTLDGTNPTATSTKYTEPFAITESVTVKAVAAKGENLSNVTTFEAKYEGTYEGYEAFLKDATSGTVGTIAGPITAIYQNGINLYTVDSKGGFMLLYGSQEGTYVNGDQFASVTGKYSPYNSLPEMANVTLGEKSTGTPVQPETVAIEEIAIDQCNKYIKIENVKITLTSGRNYTATDADGNTITLYNTFGTSSDNNKYTIFEVPEGEGFTVTGFVCRYNNTLQVTPIKVEGGKEMETVETPVFTPEAGAVEAGTKVTIECATAGAAIYYTLDGTVPTVSATEYTAPIAINEDVTIKAIAVKEGMLNSAVATAEYTIALAGTKVATFDFMDNGNAASLTTSQIEASNSQDAEGASNDLSDVKFTNGEVTMYFIKGEGSSPRWWKNSNGTELRFYNHNTLVVSINKDGYRLVDVDFVKAYGTSFPANDKVTFTPAGTFANRVWTAPADNCTEMKMELQATLHTGKVVVTYVEAPDATSAVNNIAADNDENAPAEYYNLQGVRVANPTPGLYIVKQGNKVSKQIIR